LTRFSPTLNLLKQPRTESDYASSPPKSPAILDTGATGHFVTTDAPFTNKRAAIPGITAQLPDGGTIQSTHTCSLALPFLPAAAREAHIFQFLASGSLISIELLCDHGCTALFNARTVTIKNKDCIVLTGTRLSITKLWNLEVPHIVSAPPSSNADTPEIASTTSTANAVINNPNLAERIAFYRASMFSPALSTWCTTIDAGHFTSWPELTSAQVRRYPPQSIAMVKGHLDQERVNVDPQK